MCELIEKLINNNICKPKRNNTFQIDVANEA